MLTVSFSWCSQTKSQPHLFSKCDCWQTKTKNENQTKGRLELSMRCFFRFKQTHIYLVTNWNQVSGYSEEVISFPISLERCIAQTFLTN